MARGSGTGPSNARRDSRALTRKMRERSRKPAKGEGDQTAGQPGSQAAAPPAKGPDRYLQLEVPNFNRAEDEAEAMGSYLRLGSVPDPQTAGAWDAPRATGEDLAAYATFFLDDDRKRNAEGADFVPPEERSEETAALHTKGGWRDHSDGNRISTTRGDKVEVIRGNYKLVVLGRQDDPIGAAGWDVSGSHIEGLGLQSCIEWVRTFDGTWRVVESSEKGDTITTQHGNSVSWNYGEIQDSTTGSEDEQRPAMNEEGEAIKVPAPNPVITSRTWARRIESYTGSAARRVPLVSDETWADAMTTKTHVGSMSDETTVDGHMSTTTTVSTMVDTTIADNMTSITLGTVNDITVGNTLSMSVGGVQDITVGAMLELTLAAMAEINIGGMLEVSLNARHEIDLLSSSKFAPSIEEKALKISRESLSESVLSLAFSVKAPVINLG
jgi:hypothetical protein